MHRVRETKEHFFDEGLLRVKPPVLLDGYWQCARYMQIANSFINSSFRFPEVIGPVSKKLLEDMSAGESIALHVRRGDYVSNPTFNAVHGVCGVEYYRTAIALLCGYLRQPQFYVFSDDLDWARDHLPLPQEAVFIDHNQDAPVEDLRLMAACRHNIIANSSFSWWGAFLGSHPDKRVIAPKRWYKEGRSSGELLPQEWIQL